VLPDISDLAPFKAVVVLNASYPSDWQDEVSKWLVTSGCLYMMAWGADSTTWDDSVDWAVRETYPGEDTPDDKFVMTTWHDDESLEEVFWYAQFNGNFSYNDVELVNALILDISNEDRKGEMISLFGQAESWADRQPEPASDFEKPNGWLRRLFGA
jgi:hypothetical protein